MASDLYVGFPIRSDAGTLAGGSYEAGLPLDNLQSRIVRRVARTTDLDLTSTQLVARLADHLPIRLLSLHGHNLSRDAEWRLRAWRGSQFTRGSTARYVDENGIVQVEGVNVPRIRHYEGGVRAWLGEGGRTNLCFQSSRLDESPWTLEGGTTFTPDAIVSGESKLGLLDHGAEGSSGRAHQTITFASTGVKAVAVRIAEGESPPSGSTRILLQDTSAAANRLLADVEWSAGAPVVTMTTGAHLRTEALADGIFRLWFATTSVTHTNTNSMQVRANGSVGDVYVGGVQVEAANVPSSEIPTTDAASSRSADLLRDDIGFDPQELTVYSEWVERGTAHNGSVRRYFHVDSTSNGNPRLELSGGVSAAGDIRARFRNASGSNFDTSLGAGTVSIGDHVRARITVRLDGSDWKIQLHVSINGGAEISSTETTITSDFPDAWTEPVIAIGSQPDGTVPGFSAHIAHRFAAGLYSQGEMAQLTEGATVEKPGGLLADIPVTRASVGTRIDFAGELAENPEHTPRLEYDEFGVLKGLLLEPAGTNLLVNSEQPRNGESPWSPSPATVTLDAGTIFGKAASRWERAATTGAVGGVQETALSGPTAGRTFSASVAIHNDVGPGTGFRIRIRERGGSEADADAASEDFVVAVGETRILQVTGTIAEDDRTSAGIFVQAAVLGDYNALHSTYVLEESPFPTSPTISGGSPTSRAADFASAPYTYSPAEVYDGDGLTLRDEFTEGGTALTDNAVRWQVGEGDPSTDAVICVDRGSGNYRLRIGNGTTEETATCTTLPALNADAVHVTEIEARDNSGTKEIRGRLLQQISGSESGSSDWSDWIEWTDPISGGWSGSQTVYVNSRDGGANRGRTWAKALHTALGAGSLGFESPGTTEATPVLYEWTPEELYDSGWIDAVPAIYPADTERWGEDLSGLQPTDEDIASGWPRDSFLLLDEYVTSRLWGVEISDPNNPDGYVQAGRLAISPVTELPYGMPQGAEFDWATNPQRRGWAFEQQFLTQEQAFLLQDLKRRLGVAEFQEARGGSRFFDGTVNQFVWVNDSHGLIHRPRLSFLAVLAGISPLRWPFSLHVNDPWAVQEDF